MISHRTNHPHCCLLRRPRFLVLALLLATGVSLYSQTAIAANWRTATEDELKSVIPARATVVSEHIETEIRSASGITDGKGHFVAGVVLITAGYSAEGKYSHYFLCQAPVRIGSMSLAPGQYILGWTHSPDSLHVTFYEASTGKPVGTVEALRNPSITRVEQFRIWPPGDKGLIQFGRFTFAYTIGEN